jgi:hypothetical protein
VDPTIKLTISLTGYSGRAWPEIKILVQDQVIWDRPVENQQIIHHEFSPSDNNSIQIVHHNKNNDTVVDANNNIVQDRHCLINYIKLNELVFDLDSFSRYNYPFVAEDNESIITNYLGKNGTFYFNFEYPFWKLWYNLQQRSVDSKI